MKAGDTTPGQSRGDRACVSSGSIPVKNRGECCRGKKERGGEEEEEEERERKGKEKRTKLKGLSLKEF